jgi:hypothetical protein
MNCQAAKKDGTPCQGTAKDNGYCMAHHDQGSTSAGPPAKLKGLRRARNLRVGLRGITMLRPQCKDCKGPDAPVDWYLYCPHDPYIGVREKRVEVPLYSDIQSDGARIVEGMEERVTWEVWPNFAEAVVDMRVNSGNGVEKARRKGWIMLDEVRSEAFPNGIAPMCQFRSCRWQEGLVTYKNGVYCREYEARMVGSRDTDGNGNLLYGAMPIDDNRKREKFLQQVAV